MYIGDNGWFIVYTRVKGYCEAVTCRTEIENLLMFEINRDEIFMNSVTAFHFEKYHILLYFIDGR